MIKMSIKMPANRFRVRCVVLRLCLFALLLLPVLMSAGLKAFAQGGAGKVIARADQLPAGVRRMHRALLSAARSGRIEQMRDVLQMNELMPLINGQFIHDPVKHWKAQSRDKTGREFLALLLELLELPPVKIKTNHQELYVWPYFAHASLNKLKDSEIVQLYRLAPAAKTALMLKSNLYLHARIAIGADGTWHSYDAPIVQLSEKPPQKP